MEKRSPNLSGLGFLSGAAWILSILGFLVGVGFISANQGYFADPGGLALGFVFLGVGATLLPAAFIVTSINLHAHHVGDLSQNGAITADSRD